jgi:hypothetical protein
VGGPQLIELFALAGCGGGADDSAPVANETLTTTAETDTATSREAFDLHAELPSSAAAPELEPGRVTTSAELGVRVRRSLRRSTRYTVARRPAVDGGG